MKTHRIIYTDKEPTLALDWDHPNWNRCDILSIENFHPKSSSHRPATQVKLLASPQSLQAIFRVQDQYVRSVATEYQDSVCRDSCVELFWQPIAGKGYFNLEFNCGGVMTLYYIEDPARCGDGFAKYAKVSQAHANLITVLTSLPRVNPIEITEPIEWRLAARIPYEALAPYIGPARFMRGERSRGNLFKCASLNSHPHWASWSSVGEELNFHQPDKFGEFFFD